MRRTLCASLRSFSGLRREIFATDEWNFTRNCQVLTMHKGGIRYKSEFSGDDQGQGRHSRHPSGLSGKQLGLWYAARGKKNKEKRDIKQRAHVVMDSHHEKKINQLLGEFRATEEGNVWAETGQSSQGSHDESNQVHQDNKINQHGGWQETLSDMEFGRMIPDGKSHQGYLQQDPSLDHYLQEELKSKTMAAGTKYATMQTFRKRLPAYDRRKELLELINSEQVLVVSGETGCGKTTQVAQFILDDAIEKKCGSLCRVICTQPRRISAISVAERVAAERGEKCGENGSVGFQIRLESKLPREKGSILYCTTGVLLRWLISDPFLSSTSHIILDEIHERDVLSDFLIIIARDLLPQRPDLKLILMSATLNAEMFSTYFGNCKMTHIPGFTYPVQELYLEDVIEMTGYEVEPQMNSFRRGQPGWQHRRGRRKSAAKDRRLEKSTAWHLMEGQIDDSDMEWQQYMNSLRGRYSPKTIATLQNMNLEEIDQELIVRVITHISLHMKEGAILCFLPGWDDISKLHDNLRKQRLFSSEKFLIIPLHSMMPSTNQREVFDRPPPGVRKIVIATNIAETSITIDDVVFVVDVGKVKEKTYDVNNNIACLKPVWISKASARQRRGRAGRVQPGYCFHLFTNPRAESLDDYQLPEMLRTPLEELCLQIKILKLGKIRPFLSKALQPPEEQAVVIALEVLHQLKALDANEELTPLGYHLAALPVNPRIGKIILLGAIFSCLDPVLTVASVLGFKDPFYIPLGKQMEADQARRRFAGQTRSDHLAVLSAFQGWERAARSGRDSEYCWRNFLSANTMKMIRDMKQQFSHLLYEIGFLNSTVPHATSANYYSDNLKLVKAILCAGLYPNVAKIEHHPKLNRPPKLYTQQNGRIHLHPKSVNAEVKSFEDNWMIYHEKMKSSKVYIYDSTMIAPFPLLFFGGDISVFVEEGFETVAVDGFIKFKSPTRIAHLVKELRLELDKLLKQKIAQPEMKLSVGTGSDSKESGLLRAIIDLIASEENTNWRKQKKLDSELDEGLVLDSNLPSADLMDEGMSRC